MDKKFRDYKTDTGYYDVADTITNATANDPNDYNSAVYDVHSIHNELGKNDDVIYVVNDSTQQVTGTLYCVVSHVGSNHGSRETPIYANEIKKYKNVYEIKLRSPTQNLAYRVTEYKIGYLR